MSKKYSQLTEEERIEIYSMKQAGNRLREIARQLGRQASTISREIRRNTGLKGYRLRQAQMKARERQTPRRPTQMTGTTLKHIRQRVVGVLHSTRPNTSTITRLAIVPYSESSATSDGATSPAALPQMSFL